jgi:hypothetical protein
LLNSLRREQTLTELAQTDLNYEGSPFEDLDTTRLSPARRKLSPIIKALHDKQVTELAKMPKLPAAGRHHRVAGHPGAGRMEHTGIQLNTKYLEQVCRRD